MRKLFICVFIATLFFCFLWIIVLQHQQHNGNGQHVSFFTLYYTSLFFETVERTEDTKCMMKLKKEQRYFAVFFSLAILLSASKTPIYDYNTQTTAYIPDKNLISFLTCWLQSWSVNEENCKQNNTNIIDFTTIKRLCMKNITY